MWNRDLSRLLQYQIQMRVIEIFQGGQGGLIKLSTRGGGLSACRIFTWGQNAALTKDHYWLGIPNQVWWQGRPNERLRSATATLVVSRLAIKLRENEWWWVHWKWHYNNSQIEVTTQNDHCTAGSNGKNASKCSPRQFLHLSLWRFIVFTRFHIESSPQDLYGTQIDKNQS